ncbi:hypothetical protein ACV22V_30385 [Burkholderia sp. AW33-5]
MEKLQSTRQEMRKTLQLASCLIQLMSDGRPRTKREICEALGLTSGRARSALERLVASNDVQICRSLPANCPYVYTLGTGSEEGADTRQSHRRRRGGDSAAPRVSELEREAALDRRHRADGKWWPAADPVVTAAMFALARESVTRPAAPKRERN